MGSLHYRKKPPPKLGVQFWRRFLSVVERAHLSIALLGFLMNSLESCSSSRFLLCRWSVFSGFSKSSSDKWDKVDPPMDFGLLASFCNRPVLTDSHTTMLGRQARSCHKIYDISDLLNSLLEPSPKK